MIFNKLNAAKTAKIIRDYLDLKKWMHDSPECYLDVLDALAVEKKVSFNGEVSSQILTFGEKASTYSVVPDKRKVTVKDAKVGDILVWSNNVECVVTEIDGNRISYIVTKHDDKTRVGHKNSFLWCLSYFSSSSERRKD